MAVSVATYTRLGFVATANRYLFSKVKFVHSQGSTMTNAGWMDVIPDVDIDGHGRFKYILINVRDESSNKNIVRGYARAQWHADVLDITSAELKACEQADLKAKCVGGGRIEHDPDAKTIKVYGYSQQFGKANHELSVELLKKKYPDYTVTCSDEGY